MQKVLTASRRFDAPTGGMAYTGGGNIGELALDRQADAEHPRGLGRPIRCFTINAAAVGGNRWVGGVGCSPLQPRSLLPLGLAVNRLAWQLPPQRRH